MGGRLQAVMQGNNVRMPELFEDLDLSIEVLLELFVQAPEVNRLDRNRSTRNLTRRWLSAHDF